MKKVNIVVILLIMSLFVGCSLEDELISNSSSSKTSGYEKNYLTFLKDKK